MGSAYYNKNDKQINPQKPKMESYCTHLLELDEFHWTNQNDCAHVFNSPLLMEDASILSQPFLPSEFVLYL